MRLKNISLGTESAGDEADIVVLVCTICLMKSVYIEKRALGEIIDNRTIFFDVGCSSRSFENSQ